MRLALFLLFGVLAFWREASAATLEWDPNPEANVIGYRVYVGRVSRLYDSVLDAGNQLSLEVPAGVGFTFFAVTAYDSDGMESDFSAEVFCLRGGGNTPPGPPPPVILNLPPGAIGWIQTSEDLRTWSNHQYVTSAATFLFPVDTNTPQRFYRFTPDP